MTGSVSGWGNNGIFFSSPLWPIQPPIHWVPEAHSLEVKRPGHKTVHSLPSNAEFKNVWNYTFTHPICLHDVVLS